MKQQHEWLGRVSTGHIVELEAIGSDILVLAQGWVQHAVRRSQPLGPLKEGGGMADKDHQAAQQSHHDKNHHQQTRNKESSNRHS